MSQTIAASPATRAGRRRVAFSILAGLFGLAFGGLFFGLPSVVLAWFTTGHEAAHRIHEVAWGGMAGVLLAVGALVQLRRPERKPAAMQQVVVTMVALIAGMAVAADLDPAMIVFLVVAGVMAWLHPARSEVLSLSGRLSPAMGAIVLASAVPLVVYALGQAEIGRLDTASEHAEFHHWAGMAALAFALLLVGGVASLRTRGWRISAWSVGLVAVLFGLVSVLNPDLPSSAGTGPGLAAMAGGALFVAAAEWERRRDPDRERRRDPDREARARDESLA